MDATKRIHHDEMPEPDALINYPDGSTGPAMFHYHAAEDADGMQRTADELGFDIQSVMMSEDHPVYALYDDEEPARALMAWSPDVPEGWQLGGKHDTEDGPCAYFLRRRP